jgi:glutamyl-tRNA synthetase
MKLSNEELAQKLSKFYQKETLDKSFIQKTVPLIKERIKILADYYPLIKFLLKRPTEYEVNLQDQKEIFAKIVESLLSISNWNADTIGSTMMNLAKELGISNSKFFMNLRVAVSGKKITPPLNESMEILGKKECIERIKLVS